MSRYIDADKQKNLIDNCADLGGKFGEIITLIKGYAKDMVDATPTADVRENVKGKWIIKTDGFVIKRVWGVCSECGNTLDFSGVNAGRGDANFCPNCGAYMRGDQT